MPHLLIIEDNAHMSTLLHDSFSAHGFGVTAVCGGTLACMRP